MGEEVVCVSTQTQLHLGSDESLPDVMYKVNPF